MQPPLSNPISCSHEIPENSGTDIRTPVSRPLILDTLQTTFSGHLPNWLPDHKVRAYETLKARLAKISPHYPDIPRIERRLKSCFQDWHIYYSGEQDKFGVKPHRCCMRICPLCEGKRQQVLKERFDFFLSKIESPMLWTFTLKSSPYSLAECHSRIVRAFAFLRKMPVWAENVAGGFWVFEATFNQNTGQWHPHLHVIVDSRFVPVNALRQCWQMVTKDSHVIHFRHIYHRDEAADYLAKYISKGIRDVPMSDDRFVEFTAGCKGLRFWATFGSLYKLRLDPTPIDPPDNSWEYVGMLSKLDDFTHSRYSRREILERIRPLIYRIDRDEKLSYQFAGGIVTFLGSADSSP